jgi:hypothetical protein
MPTRASQLSPHSVGQERNDFNWTATIEPPAKCYLITWNGTLLVSVPLGVVTVT